MIRQWSVAGFVVFCSGLPSQNVQLDNGLTITRVEVEAASQVAVALAIPVGWGHDPAGRTGLAELVRWWLTLAQRHEVPGHRFTVTVHADHTLISHTGPQRFLGQRIGFLRKILAGELRGDADLLALSVGRARLEADNHAWLLPGSVIKQKAWRTLFAGQPLGRQSLGIPGELAGVDLDELRGRLALYGPTGAALAIYGSVDAAALAAVERELGGIPRAPEVAVPVAVHDSGPPVQVDDEHERVNGPFVSVALRAVGPKDADFVPFVLGVAALRIQAHFRFGETRGAEWRAAFPYVDYRYWQDQRLVLINRRGKDLSEPEAAKQEIEGLLAGVRKHGVGAQRFEAARREVLNVLAGASARNSSGPLLSQRARYRAMASCRSWPADFSKRLQEVSAADVDRVLKSVLAADRLRWFSLEPTEETVRRLRKFHRVGGERGFSVQSREGDGRRMP